MADVENRVVGPPGCGKTTWLARQCELAAERMTGEAVVVASLTRTAAAEVAGRKTRIPQQNIGTLHAHAYRALERPALAETAEGVKEFNASCSARFKLTKGSVSDPENASPEMPAAGEADGDQLLGTMGVLRHKVIERRLWPAMVSSFADQWDSFKADSRRVDFTDLLVRAMERIDEHPAGPRVMMVDEAQDLSLLEMGLVRHWSAGIERLVVVGDPDQALYTWRGADPAGVFGSDIDGVSVLHQSWRVPEQVRRAAVGMIERIPTRLPVRYESRQHDGAAVEGEIVRLNHRWEEPWTLIHSLRAQLDEGKSVMVLASCGYMLAPLLRELRKAGMPFANPYRTNRGDWNPLGGARRLLAYLRPDPSAWGEDHRLWTWDDLRLWTEPLKADGALMHGAKALITEKCREDRFRSTRAHDHVPLDLVLDLLDGDETKAAVLCHDLNWWESHLRDTEAKRQRFPLRVARTHGAVKLREQPKLCVGTVHSVKGGEADVVYLWPDLSPSAYWEGYQKPGETRDAIFRLMYVGMTRAREMLCLLEPSGAEYVPWR